MALNIPSRYESQIEQIAETQQISADEALHLVLEAGLERYASVPSEGPASYGSLFGAVKNGYGSKEAIDLAIAEMRSEW